MEKEDHLDKETSVSAELTPTGVKASAKSRAIAAFDRLLGNVFERWNAPMESKTAEARAVSASRLKVIEAVTKLGIERLERDPEAANRALENHLGKVFERQDNKDAVVAAAVDDLSHQPPTDDEAVSGAEELQDSFMNRFERFAEEATTEETRLKWGRVLASEIRKPGTFSAKVMRVIDEIDPQTAGLFEKVCTSRLSNVLPKSLIGELSFPDIISLTDAGLLVEPGIGGQLNQSQDVKDGSGTELWMQSFGNLAIAYPKDGTSTLDAEAITFNDGKPAIRVYVLTNVGLAISSILPETELKALTELAAKMGEAIGDPSKIRKYKRTDGDQFVAF
ncbi:DUF2806 domain-containing protein [Mesorhizobium sp. INR15]|uniref:DUF2806 domain-containing protein n=1 Tax=Mesorhizobium sp. INR15 TaxID=2654248 RepID=UPI001896476A|nr:DUF2806 domain-containing protein [Mesorhizobium sp. INR15]QPC93537.1 DUF2806 domain-containing protein [Mesorhizobium sp. INR15]